MKVSVLKAEMIYLKPIKLKLRVLWLTWDLLGWESP